MTYFFIGYLALPIKLLSSINFVNSENISEEKEKPSSSLLSFSFNLKNFDNFKCDFSSRSTDILTSDCTNDGIYRAEHVFFDVFCIMFLYSELKHNKIFFDWARRLFICRYNNYVKPINFIHQYKRIMPDFSKIIKLLGNNIYKIITCTFDKCLSIL
ncbi:hypothetical protein NBO_318g0001 [Nosema bombycis CQ1]|uniref:Uncharacterized protein n=1 Tax=Nosema bombycis (strain CQ1 / CVCC 102059) TaxID=578461 RepID=R0KQB7_NOSB1|nr:hypothetical protein NBO_318g0001 [Nosema bombycis CQ1]|eukprot:EOB12911.1 hypothetical protein NBO_318g0001 [Nosema bombycis CQ1]